jgi:PST family polysaccharide transporter
MAEMIAIIIEFGFCLSATRSIAQYRNDAVRRGEITMGVLCAQTILAVAAVTVAVIAAGFIPLFREHRELLACGLLYALAQGFSPIWYFQGTERIRLAAILEIGSKLAALTAFFVFVTKPQDVWRALAIQGLSPWALVLCGIPLALSSSTLCRPQWDVVKSVLIDGWHMFVFRSTESLYGAGNAFLLGLYAPPVLVGYFAAAEKVSKAVAGLVNPVRESFYPRISRLVHENPQEAIRLGRIGMLFMVGIGIFSSVILLVFAGPLITTLMGGRFDPAVRALEILSPLPVLLAMTFSFGQLWLLPRKQDRPVLRIVMTAAAVNLSLSFLLAPRFGHLGMSMAVLISESAVAGGLLRKFVQQVAKPQPNESWGY